MHFLKNTLAVIVLLASSIAQSSEVLTEFKYHKEGTLPQLPKEFKYLQEHDVAAICFIHSIDAARGLSFFKSTNEGMNAVYTYYVTGNVWLQQGTLAGMTQDTIKKWIPLVRKGDKELIGVQSKYCVDAGFNYFSLMLPTTKEMIRKAAKEDTAKGA